MLKPEMPDLLKLLEVYRASSELDQRLEAGEALASELYPFIFPFILKRLGWRLADDVVQETMMDIFRGLPNCRATTLPAFRGWFYRIASNKINDALRSKYAADAEPLNLENVIKMQLAAALETISPGTKADLEYLLQWLRASKFPCDEILWNYIYLDKDIREIGEMYGLDYDAARMKITRCLKTAQELAKNA